MLWYRLKRLFWRVVLFPFLPFVLLYRLHQHLDTKGKEGLKVYSEKQREAVRARLIANEAKNKAEKKSIKEKLEVVREKLEAVKEKLETEKRRFTGKTLCWGDKLLTELGDKHLWNIIQAVENGHWADGRVATFKPEIQEALCTEYRKRHHAGKYTKKKVKKKNDEFSIKDGKWAKKYPMEAMKPAPQQSFCLPLGTIAPSSGFTINSNQQSVTEEGFFFSQKDTVPYNMMTGRPPPDSPLCNW